MISPGRDVTPDSGAGGNSTSRVLPLDIWIPAPARHELTAWPKRAHRAIRSVPVIDGAGNATEHDIACRAYDLYLRRACEHGHDIEDWIQEERELRRLSAA